MNRTLLRTEGLNRFFGELRAVNEVSFEVLEGQVRAVIGPNGAGKSTLMDLICNRTTPSSGKVFFNDEDITGVLPHKIVHKGICKCFQISQIFSNLTVFENVQLARINMNKKAFSFLPASQSYLKSEVEHYLELVGIPDKINEVAGFMSYGDQRRLDIAIAIAMEPKLLILDEPAAGVAREEAHKLMQLIRKLGEEQHTTMLFIEHDMDIVFNYSDVISVMKNGSMIATGVPEEIKKNAFVREAYLGGETE